MALTVDAAGKVAVSPEGPPQRITAADLARATGADPKTVAQYWAQAVANGANPRDARAVAEATLALMRADSRSSGTGAAPGAAPSVPGSGGGGYGGGGGGSAGPTPQQIANMEAGFAQVVRQWGMELTPKLRNLVSTAARSQWNSASFLQALRDTEEYNAQFPGIKWRRGMSEAQYNSTFNSYVGRGQDSGVKLSREGFAKLLKNGVDAQEWALRVQAVKQVRANKPLLEEFRQVLVSRGALKPNQELPAKEVKKLVIGKGSPQWTAIWNQASVASGLEGIGIEVGRGGDMSHKELLRMLRTPMSQLAPGETINVDFAQLAETASKALPASRLYGMGVTKKDLVKMALGGKGADKIAERVQLAIGTAQATASEQRVNPQLTAGGLQLGSQREVQATE